MDKNKFKYDRVALYIIIISSLANIILTFIDYSDNGHTVSLLTMLISFVIVIISSLRLIKEKNDYLN